MDSMGNCLDTPLRRVENAQSSQNASGKKIFLLELDVRSEDLWWDLMWGVLGFANWYC